MRLVSSRALAEASPPAATKCARCGEVHPYLRNEDTGEVVTVLGSPVVLCPKGDPHEVVFVPSRYRGGES